MDPKRIKKKKNEMHYAISSANFIFKIVKCFFFHSKFYKRVLNKKETELTLRSIFSTSTFNEFYLFAY